MRPRMLGCMRVFIAAVLMGCGGASEPAAVSSAETDCGCSIDVEAERTFAIEGRVVALAGKAPLAGVEVCIQHHPEVACVATAADGLYRLEGAPAGVDDALTFRKVGYASILAPYGARMMDLTDSEEMLAVDDLRAAAASAGAADPALAAHGAVVLNLFTGPLGTTRERVSGATATIDGGAKGPFYPASDGSVDPTATASTTAGAAVFFDVAPGNHVVEVKHPTLSCTDRVFLWGDGRTPVSSGFVSTPSINCPTG